MFGLCTSRDRAHHRENEYVVRNIVVGVGETLVPPILEFSHSCRVDFNSSPELSVMVATPG